MWLVSRTLAQVWPFRGLKSFALHPVNTYRITFRDRFNQLHSHPVISSSVTEAVADLTRLGYDITRIDNSLPSITSLSFALSHALFNRASN